MAKKPKPLEEEEPALQSEPPLRYNPNDTLIFVSLLKDEIFMLELYLSANDLSIDEFLGKLFKEFIKTRYSEIQECFQKVTPTSESQELLTLLTTLKGTLKL